MWGHLEGSNYKKNTCLYNRHIFWQNMLFMIITSLLFKHGRNFSWYFGFYIFYQDVDLIFMKAQAQNLVYNHLNNLRWVNPPWCWSFCTLQLVIGISSSAGKPPRSLQTLIEWEKKNLVNSFDVVKVILFLFIFKFYYSASTLLL